MNATRRSAASRRKDQQIHEALVSGLSPAQVAAALNLAVEQVTTAQHRVEEDLAALSSTQRSVQQQRTALRAIFTTAIASFRQSGVTAEESTSVSTKAGSLEQNDRRTSKQKRADPRYLRIALFALSQERALLRLDERPRKKPKAGNVMRKHIEFMKKQTLEHPEIAADFVHHQRELVAGMRLPRYGPLPRTGMPPPTDTVPPSSN